MTNHPNRSRFRWIDPAGRDITGTAAVAGYAFRDFFDCDLQGASDGELAASYRGPDCDGVGVRWTE